MLPNVTSFVFGIMTPTVQIPRAVILNQIQKEGIYIYLMCLLPTHISKSTCVMFMCG